MVKKLKSKFKDAEELSWVKAGIDNLCQYVLDTEIGQKLYDDFVQSGGTIWFVEEIDEHPTARGVYNIDKNHVTLSSKATAGTLVHELGHARQCRKEPKILKEKLDIESEAQISIILEADSWTLTSIFYKQFFTNHSDDLDLLERFLDLEEKLLKHSKIVTPDEIDGTKGSWLERQFRGTLDYMRSLRKDNSERDEKSDELMEDILTSSTTYLLACDVFRSCFDEDISDPDVVKSNSANYSWHSQVEAFINLFQADDVEKAIDKKRLGPDDFQSLILNFADLNDLGINDSYIYDEDDMDWCIYTHPSIRRNFREIASYMKTEMIRRGMPVSEIS